MANRTTNLSRKEIQLQNLLRKKGEIENLLFEINSKLNVIDQKIKEDNEIIIKKWRERFMINKSIGLPPPDKPVNYFDLITQKKNQINEIQELIYIIQGQLGQLPIELSSQQLQINNILIEEKVIYQEEFFRINEKYKEFNNNYLSLLENLVEKKTDLLEKLDQEYSNFCNNQDIYKKSQGYQLIIRNNLRDQIHHINKMKKITKEEINKINEELQLLGKELENIHDINKITRNKFNHLKKIYDNNPIEYQDLLVNINDLSYDLNNHSRLINKLKKNICNLETEKNKISLCTRTEINDNEIVCNPYPNLKLIKNAIKAYDSIKVEIENAIKEIDNKIWEEENSYVNEIRNLVDDLNNCEERWKIMEDRCKCKKQEYELGYQNNKKKLIEDNNKNKNKISTLEKEIQELEIKYKTERNSEYEKKELLDKKEKLINILQQVEKDLSLIGN